MSGLIGRSSLFLKIFLSFLLVIIVWTAAVMIANTSVLRSTLKYRMDHMSMMEDGDHGGMMGSEMMDGNGRSAVMLMTSPEIQRSFIQAANDALRIALAAAVIIAILASLIISQQLVTPVRRMTTAAQRIADGHYSERVPLPDGVEEESLDQLGKLAYHFNHMAENLEETESIRRQLIGDVAHELRTPLTTIKGSMEGLIDGILPNTSEVFMKVYHEAGRLERLVSDLQELSRVEGGAYELDFQTCRPAKLVHTAVERIKPLFDNQDITLAVDIAPDLPEITLDEDRIGQVLMNILSNALHYSSTGDMVQIKASSSGQSVTFEVKDNGIGISPEDLPHLFTRFYRVDKSRSRASGGTGIGLTIARHMVEAHGGWITAQSDGPGMGSTFTFTLPIDPSPAREAKAM